MNRFNLFETITHCVFAFFVVISNTYAEYGQKEFQADWVSPLYEVQAQKTLWYGSALTGFLIINRQGIVEPFQKSVSEQQPLGDLAPLGDIMGQMVPNTAYMLYQYYGDNDPTQAGYMFKVSAFSGLTVFFSKRIINQRRPNKGDRNSFPSGHTSTAFAFAGVIHQSHPQWKIPAYALATLVGFSRINDNAHYLHDVTMGATLGIAYAYALKPKSMQKVSVTPTLNGLLLTSRF